eukprot:207643-Pyramimonas_sp.AAC.1
MVMMVMVMMMTTKTMMVTVMLMMLVGMMLWMVMLTMRTMISLLFSTRCDSLEWKFESSATAYWNHGREAQRSKGPDDPRAEPSAHSKVTRCVERAESTKSRSTGPHTSTGAALKARDFTAHRHAGHIQASGRHP